MKTKRKALLTLMCAVLLVMVSILGTLAYLTDRDHTVNTFTVGNVDITLDEKNVDEDDYGEEDEPNIPDRDQQNDYHLLPGLTYTKDPLVTVEPGSEDCYVRMLVTISKSSEWDALFEDGKYTITDFLDLNNTDWAYAGNTENESANTRTYEFRYNKIVPAVSEDAAVGTQLPKLFTSITIPGTITGDELALLEGFEMNLEAHAIQAAGFAADLTAYVAEEAEKAWDAFEN